MPPLPNLFIPGAPKCGTSAIAGYLDTHPDVGLGNIKEPNFWSSDLPSFAKREGLNGLGDYTALYSRQSDKRYRVDASTHYLYSEVAIQRIIEVVPNARFIVCLRPQPEIAQAWHMQMFNAGYETESDFLAAWNLRTARRSGTDIPNRCPEPRLLDYEAIASVGSQMQRLFEAVSRDQVHVMRLSSLKQNPRSVYLSILEFLNLPDDGTSEFAATNVAHRNRSATLSHLIRNPRVRPLLNRALAILGPKKSQWIKTGIKKALYKPAARAGLSTLARTELNEIFSIDDQRLRATLGYGLLESSINSTTTKSSADTHSGMPST